MDITVDPDSALLLVDVQQGFEDPMWGRRDNPSAENNIARLIDAWQTSRRPIVVITHQDDEEGSPLGPDAVGQAVKAELEGVQPSLRVQKTVNSAFYGTPDLHEWLGRARIRQVTIAGIQTNMCNETTARMAGNLGYDVLFVLDAMHTFDVTGPDGEAVSAEELTRATAASLHAGGFARVVKTDQVVEAAHHAAEVS